MANQPPDGETVRHAEMVAVVLAVLRPGQQPDGLRRELRLLCRVPRRDVGQECRHPGPVLWVDLVRRRQVGDVVRGAVELDDRHLAAELPCHELRGLRRPRQRAVLNRSEGTCDKRRPSNTACWTPRSVSLPSSPGSACRVRYRCRTDMPGIQSRALRCGRVICVETLGSKQVYANPWLTVREDEVRRPDGHSGTYCVVERSDIALIIPADGDRLHLVEQYRHPIARRCWSSPPGSADTALDTDAAGWPHASCARRPAGGRRPDPARHARRHAEHVEPAVPVFLATDLVQAHRNGISRNRTCGRPGSPAPTSSA